MKLDTNFDAKNTSGKQKILVTLIVLAFAFVVWQIYGMFGSATGGSSSAATMPKPIVPRATISSQAAAGTSYVDSQAQYAASAQPASAATPNEFAPTNEQSQYMQLINQYQLLKMKRMLLEEEVAVASARQKIADLNSKTGDLGGDVDSMDIGGGNFGDNGAAYPTSNKGEYKVVFIDRQNGEWNATLSYGGRFDEVNVGSELPDGTQIIAIDSKGVVIKKGLNLTRLTFSGAVPVEGTNENGKAAPTATPGETNGETATTTKATANSEQIKQLEQDIQQTTTPQPSAKASGQSKDSAKKKL